MPKASGDVVTIDSLSIAAWNVCGIKSKLDDPEFITQLNPHHIIILGETFLSNDELHIQGFKCKNIFYRKKHKKAKRHSGGVSVLIKSNIEKYVSPVKTTAESLIWLKISNQLTGFPQDTYCCCAYIPPYGSPYYTTHPDLDLFDLLSHDLSHYAKIGHVMVSGDLNSRIGSKPDALLCTELNAHIDTPGLDTIKPPPRLSMDSKSNVWGNKLLDLCIAHNLCLLNGRTIGDLAGNFTFFGPGFSVIDLTIVDDFLLHKTLSFKVHAFLPELSSHCKIEAILPCTPIAISARDPTVQNLKFNKYSWNNNVSRDKLVKACLSPEFIAMKNNIANTNYDFNRFGTESLTADVSAVFEYLHNACCDKISIGHKPRGRAKVNRQKWFSPNLSTLRKRLRRAANHLHRHPFDSASKAEV